jgi:hypothetical protein
MKEEIVFIHGMPEPAKKWEKEINGKTFTFAKERAGKKGIFFSYNCARYSEDSRFI